MSEKDIKKALNLIDLLEGIRNFLLTENNIEKLIDKGIANILPNSSYTFQKQKNNFRKHILVDFKDVIQYTKEDEFDELTYFSNRKYIKELNTEYYDFYNYLSEEIKNEDLHKDIIDNLSYIFKETYANAHKKRL